MNHPIDLLARDESHPIPDLEVCDIHGVRKDGGHDLVIVIASPLRADERSRARLNAKIAAYLGVVKHLGTQRGQSSIVVKIHPGSDQEIFDTIARTRNWIEEHGASLVIDQLP